MRRSATVLPEDRLGMTLFLAVVVHALLILGVGLSWQPPQLQEPAVTMEVTLTRSATARAPDEADFLAEHDRAGGGPAAGGGSQGLGRLLSGGSVWAVLGGFFAAGLMLAFTACLYPMIPILSGIIVGAQSGGRPGTGRALWLSFVYVQAMAVAYAAAGAAAGVTGRAVQADLQGPWVSAAFAALFVALAGAMFGLYN
ncbi:hypothetical protein CKO13_11840, partial [Halorhodospira neutriphila]|nr:hypothetical protein [Halorhodospira neutriphila]